MDYEKLHKDTINRLQQMVSCGKITVEVARGICADFIPESEDEKVRKALIHYMKDYSDGTGLIHAAYGVSRNDAIVWLEKQGEKQGEQKPADEVEPKFKVGDTVKDPYGDLYHIAEITDDSYKTDDGRFILFTNEKFYTLSNPAWSEEDEIIWGMFIEMADSEPDENFYGATKERCSLWLKSLKERVQPQLKQEWSEEDNRNLSIAINYVFQHGYLSIVDWLRNLKDRYTWKPSDEQLKSLKEVIDVGHFTSYPNSLETLYEQLKKLKGE